MTEVVHDEPSLCRANQLMGNDPALTAHRLRFAAPRWTTTPSICGAPLDDNAYEPLAGGTHLA